MTPAEKIAADRKGRKEAGKRPSNRTVRTVKWKCRCRRERRELNLPMREVAKHLGISISSLYELERGADIRLTHALLLAQFYGKPIEQIWERI